MLINNFFKSILRASKYNFSGYVSHRQKVDNNDSTPFDFTPENYKQIQTLLTKYPSKWKRSAIIPLLTMAQKQNNNFLSLNAMRKVAKIVEVNEMDVFEVASFYTMFNRERVGKYHLQICGTTPCQLRGSEKIIEACQKHLGIKNGQTTSDYMFTIQQVQCLGACANAPMIQVNGQWVYQDLTPENTVQLLQDLKNGKAKIGPQINRNGCEGPQGRTSLKDVNHEKQVRYQRDFAQAKKEWQQAERKKAEEEKRKAQQAKRIEQERKKAQLKKPS